jgi:hypothetical protein
MLLDRTGCCLLVTLLLPLHVLLATFVVIIIVGEVILGFFLLF